MKNFKNKQIFVQHFSKKQRENFIKLMKIQKNPGEHETRLLEIATQYSLLFSKIPGILGIAICNSVAQNNAHKKSDIDLFIITRRNRIWTARIYITLLLMILQKRKTFSRHKEKFCLSFFIDESAMNFEKISIKNDIYLAYWIEHLIPIINRNHIFQKFYKENSWYTFEGFSQKREKKVLFESNFVKENTFFGDIFEKFFKSIFLKRTKKSFLKKGKPFGVIISNHILKFHDTDKRKIISQKIFQEKQ